MKNRLLIASLLFAAAGVVSAEDLSVKQTALDASTPWSWNDISNWNGGTTLDGSNLTVKGSLSADNTGTIDSALTAGTLTFDIDSSDFQSKTVLNAAATFDSIVFNNGNVYIDASLNGKGLGKIKNGIIVKSLGNVTICNSDNTLNLNGKGIDVTNDRSKGLFTVLGGVTDGGVLKMTAAEGAKGANVKLHTFNQTWSGIDDGGVQANHLLITSGKGVWTFYNFTKNDWSGELQSDQLTINFNGGNESNYGQRLNLTSFSSTNWTGDGEAYAGRNGLKVNVNSGNLILNETSTTHCFLNLSGGTFGTEDVINFTDGFLNGGNIKVFNKVNGQNAFIGFEKASKADGVKIGLDFSAITEAEEYLIMVLGDTESSTGFDFANAENDFEIKGLSESLKASLAWKDGYQLVATITAAVPEPATVAAILGAIALGFAAYRRRK